MDQRRIGGTKHTKKSKKIRTKTFGVVPRIMGKIGLNKTVKKKQQVKKDLWFILRDIHVDKLLEFITDKLNNMNENATGYYEAKGEVVEDAHAAIESNSLAKMKDALKKFFIIEAEFAGENNASSAGKKEYYKYIRNELTKKLNSNNSSKKVGMNNLADALLGIQGIGSRAAWSKPPARPMVAPVTTGFRLAPARFTIAPPRSPVVVELTDKTIDDILGKLGNLKF